MKSDSAEKRVSASAASQHLPKPTPVNYGCRCTIPAREPRDYGHHHDHYCYSRQNWRHLHGESIRGHIRYPASRGSTLLDSLGSQRNTRAHRLLSRRYGRLRHTCASPSPCPSSPSIDEKSISLSSSTQTSLRACALSAKRKQLPMR